jgi:6,7-dimethyl-8-ribityllumazine synthase
MLKQIKTKPVARRGGHYAIVASKYNARFVNGMVRAAEGCLKTAGIESLQLVRVPGAYEIPPVAAWLAEHYGPVLSAVICLGVVIRGETAHAQLIGEAITHALMQIQVQHHVPVIHEVLLLENVEQAARRCLSADHNRGTEAAQTALEIAAVMRKLRASEAKDLAELKKIGLREPTKG